MKKRSKGFAFVLAIAMAFTLVIPASAVATTFFRNEAGDIVNEAGDIIISAELLKDRSSEIPANAAKAFPVRNRSNGDILADAVLLNDSEALLFDEANAQLYKVMQYREYSKLKYGESVVEQTGTKHWIRVYVGFNPVSPNFYPPATAPYTEYYGNYMLYGILSLEPATVSYGDGYSGCYAFYSGYVEEFIIS